MVKVKIISKAQLKTTKGDQRASQARQSTMHK